MVKGAKRKFRACSHSKQVIRTDSASNPTTEKDYHFFCGLFVDYGIAMQRSTIIVLILQSYGHVTWDKGR